MESGLQRFLGVFRHRFDLHGRFRRLHVNVWQRRGLSVDALRARFARECDRIVCPDVRRFARVPVGRCLRFLERRVGRTWSVCYVRVGSPDGCRAGRVTPSAS